MVFGGNALVERPMSSVRELAPLRSTPVKGNTDLEEAIGLGLALYPADTRQTDGHPQRRSADGRRCRSGGAARGGDRRRRSATCRLRAQAAPEVQLSDVRVPGSVGAGQSFDLSLTVTAEAATPATITVFAAGEIIHREQVDLQQGANHYVAAAASGRHRLPRFSRAGRSGSATTAFYQNNQLSTFSQVVGPPRVLLVSTTRRRRAVSRSGA